MRFGRRPPFPTHFPPPEIPMSSMQTQVNPIDALVNKVASAGKGFVLQLAQEQLRDDAKSLRIEVIQPPPAVAEYRPPAAVRRHTVHNTESLIAMARKYGTADDSLILVNDDTAVLVLEEELERGDREMVLMAYRKSESWQIWESLLNKPTDHKTLLQAAIRASDTLDEPTILESMRTVRASAKVAFDSDLRDQGTSVGVVFTTTKGDELLKFPKQFTITAPVLELDADDASLYARATIRIEVMMPETPNDGLRFLLTCPEWRNRVRDRVDREVKIIREALPGFTVVMGSHVTQTPNVQDKAIYPAR
jgi:hypothetical protein